jgi:hypothetical protein
MKNKKGWIKIVEAFIAILLIGSVALIIISDEVSKDSSGEINNFENFVLKKIQVNPSLRGYILAEDDLIEWANFPSQVKAAIEDEVPGNLECQAKICPPSSTCLLTEARNTNIYAESIFISTNLDGPLDPRILKLFCWER